MHCDLPLNVSLAAMKMREYVIGHDGGSSHGSKTYVVYGTSTDLEALGKQILSAAHNPSQPAGGIAVERNLPKQRNYIEFRSVDDAEIKRLQTRALTLTALRAVRFCVVLAILFLAWLGVRSLWP